MDKKTYYIVGSIGTVIGGYIPVLFGASAFGLLSCLCGGIGGVLAIVAVYRLWGK